MKLSTIATTATLILATTVTKTDARLSGTTSGLALPDIDCVEDCTDLQRRFGIDCCPEEEHWHRTLQQAGPKQQQEQQPNGFGGCPSNDPFCRRNLGGLCIECRTQKERDIGFACC